MIRRFYYPKMFIRLIFWLIIFCFGITIVFSALVLLTFYALLLYLRRTDLHALMYARRAAKWTGAGAGGATAPPPISLRRKAFSFE